MLGKRLLYLRNKRGLTQEELAKIFCMSRSTYAQYEVDRRKPDYDTLQKIADYFEVSTDFLLGRTDDTAMEKCNFPYLLESEQGYNTQDAHRSDDPMEDLPEEARKALEEFKEFILRKYRKGD
ncbi:XRE family transcriptional regulator [Desulfosporosinus fructosivorans]|uniref:XRE family transcriptional regulator n=1 Tax=Desulfosporosinus fructosivorans TaxID=2018669 RepID=A0A4Z0R9B9_9FIRM|nr:helix-turn-helix transcriptional regulator [Desulfosporosinus fructosivorans]TGE39801.1 XRE family transcriptional regulator [Desulfosporosinus fructosivorans]